MKTYCLNYNLGKFDHCFCCSKLIKQITSLTVTNLCQFQSDEKFLILLKSLFIVPKLLKSQTFTYFYGKQNFSTSTKTEKVLPLCDLGTSSTTLTECEDVHPILKRPCPSYSLDMLLASLRHQFKPEISNNQSDCSNECLLSFVSQQRKNNKHFDNYFYNPHRVSINTEIHVFLYYIISSNLNTIQHLSITF